MKKIILLGYMGCGKSTIAQKLSGMVSIPYVDLDEYIEKNEKYFNLLESVIHTRVDFKNAYGDGLTVKELDKESKATQEIKSLTKEIDNIIKNK